jgi:hypothetical protein
MLNQVTRLDHNFCNGFLCQEFVKSYCIVGRAAVMVENPFVRSEVGILLPMRFRKLLLLLVSYL